MWKLPPDSEALEEIDKAFQQYKQNLEDDHSDCSSNVTPNIAQVVHKSQNIYISDRNKDSESVDSKKNPFLSMCSASDTVAVHVPKKNVNLPGLALAITTLLAISVLSIVSLVIYRSTPNNVTAETTQATSITQADFQSAILPSSDTVLTNYKNPLFGNIFFNFGADPYPSSYSIFAKNDDVVENPVPLLFDITGGPGSSFFPRALTRCLNYKQISLKRGVNTVHTGEFFNTDSLCEFANTHTENLENRKLKIFILLRNPIVASIIKFKQMKHPSNKYYDASLDSIELQEYMTTSMAGNLLTRSIVCKSKDEKLTEEDFKHAKEFIATRCIVEIYDGHGEKALKTFLETFKNQDNALSVVDDMDECVGNELKGAQAVLRSISDVQIHVQNSMDVLAAANDYDMKLYHDVLNLDSA